MSADSATASYTFATVFCKKPRPLRRERSREGWLSDENESNERIACPGSLMRRPRRSSVRLVQEHLELDHVTVMLMSERARRTVESWMEVAGS